MEQSPITDDAEFYSVRVGPHVFNFAALGQTQEGGAHAYSMTVENDGSVETPSFKTMMDAAEQAIGGEVASTDGSTVLVRHDTSEVASYMTPNPFEIQPESKPLPVGEWLFPVPGQD